MSALMPATVMSIPPLFEVDLLTGGRSRWDGGAEDALLGGEVDLDRGVAPGVVDLAGVDLLDGHLDGDGGGGAGGGEAEDESGARPGFSAA